MDEERTRSQIEEHANAVVRGDMDAVAADCSDDLRLRPPEIAGALPQPVTAGDVLSLDVGEVESVATIRYSGDSGEVTIRAMSRRASRHVASP
jgi:hypothetical protein